MSIYVGASGAHKSMTAGAVGAGGVWKTIQAIWVGAGGVWKQAYSAVVLTLTTATAENNRTSGAASAVYQIRVDRFIYTSALSGATIVQQEQWCPSTATPTDYEVMATVTAGTLNSGTTGSYIAITGTHAWSVTRSTIGVSSATIRIDIRRIGDTTVLASKVINFTAER